MVPPFLLGCDTQERVESRERYPTEHMFRKVQEYGTSLFLASGEGLVLLLQLLEDTERLEDWCTREIRGWIAAVAEQSLQKTINPHPLGQAPPTISYLSLLSTGGGGGEPSLSMSFDGGNPRKNHHRGRI